MSTGSTEEGEKSVLCVTGDVARAAALERELGARNGIDVVTASTVGAALAAVREQPGIECIVSDYDLPDADGVAFLETIRAQHPDFPFVLFTDEGSEETASRAIHARVTDYVVRTPAEDQYGRLASLVEKAISYHEAHRGRSERESRIRTVLEAVDDPIAVVRDESFCYVNRRALELFGAADAAELDAVAPAELISPEGRELTAETLRAVQSGGTNVDRLEQVIVGLNGSRTPVDLTATAVEWSGRPATFIICHDISEREEHVTELRRLRRAVEAAGHAVYITDTDGTIEYANPAFEDVTGYPPDEAVGKTPRILRSGEMPDGYYDALWETVTSGDVWREEVVNRRRDGGLYHARQTIAPVTDGEEVVAYVAIQTDVTDRHEQNERLKRYEQAIESTSDVLLAVDEAHRILFVNRAFREFHGESGDRLDGTPLESVLGREWYETIEPHLDRALAGETVEYEATRTDAHGNERTFEVQYFPLEADDGSITGVVKRMRDVTVEQEREAANSRLSEYRRVASALNQSLVRASSKREFLPTAASIIGSCDRFRCTFLSLVENGQVEFACGSGSPLEDDDVAAFHTRAYLDAVFDVGVLHMADVTEPPFEQHEPGHPSHAGVAVAITHESTRFGVLTVHFPSDEPGREEEVELLRELADDIGLFLQKQTLQENLRLFKEIGDRIDDPVMLQDRDGRFEVVNRAVTEFADMTEAELLGSDEFAFMDEDAAATVQEMKRRAIAEDRQVEYQVTTSFPKRSSRTFSTVRYPHYDENGDIDGTVAICRDVTALKERERQLRVVDRVLRHNIRNSMNVISGYAELISESGEGELASFADQIADTGERLLETVDKEREITRFLADPPQREQLDLVGLVERTVATFREEHPSVDLTTDLPDRALVSASETLVDAVEELVRNAIEHSHRQTPSVTVSVTAGSDGVRLVVSDDGPGIPEMEQRVLSGDAEIAPLYHGSGLGLWLVTLVVRAADGVLEFDDNEPQGSVVTVTLPAA
jgi:PAS domain S-box-containing protein